MQAKIYKFDKKTQAHSFYLGHGHTVAMASSPKNRTGSTGSFQARAVHEVPYLKSEHAEGWRLNLTVRTIAREIRDPLTDLDFKPTKDYDIGEGCHVLVWDNIFTTHENEMIQGCLLETIHAKGIPDITKMYGKTFTNKGRKVIEMSGNDGFEYHYAGKTVTGIAWPRLIRELVVPKLSQIFGVQDDELWGHLVYYPTSECKLDYHDDGEDGINPHLIVSITYLENPKKPRPFRVRLKSSFKKEPKEPKERSRKKIKT